MKPHATTKTSPPGDLQASTATSTAVARPMSPAERRAADVIAARKAASASGTVARRDATGESIERRADTAAAALAANAEAMAKARFFVAMQRPRDLSLVQHQLIEACTVPEFAEEAVWELERWDSRKGEKTLIQGFSVRFAEAVRQALGNLDVDTQVVWDDDERLLLQVVVTDLETNNTERAPVVVRKRIERRRLRKDQVPIETRKGSNGQQLFIVGATDDEIVEATNRGVAKAMRNAILRLLRADIKQACWEQVQATNAVAARAEGAAEKLVAKLESVGVTREQVQAFLGHSRPTLTVEEYQRLGGIGRAISDGETTWAEATGLAPEQGEADYSVIPPIKPATAPTAPTATTGAAPAAGAEEDRGGMTKDGLISECAQLAAEAGIEWDECAAFIAKAAGGTPPQSLAKCSKLQLEKLQRWLAQQVEAAQQADEQEREG